MARTFCIQTSGPIRDLQEKSLVDALVRAGQKFFTFGVVPFTTEITGWEDIECPEPGDRLFLHCSTKVIRILFDYSIDPTSIFVGASPQKAAELVHHLRDGLFYDLDYFDQSFHLKIKELRPLMLNGDGVVQPIQDFIDVQVQERTFVKPTKDLKMFAGLVLEDGESLRSALSRATTDVSFADHGELVLTSPIKNILKEYRFFVLYEEVICGSQYKDRDLVKPDRNVPAELYAEAARIAKLFKPASAFTLDLCILDTGEIKIVEYNCMNCSGFYDIDFDKFVDAITSW